VLDIAMAEPLSEPPGVGADAIGQCEPARVSQHVWMYAEIQAGSGAQASDQDAKASGCERRAALVDEDERRRRILLALQPAQCAQLAA
jgi:hypothetical protein